MNCYSIPLRCFKKVILRLCENSDLIYEIFTLGKRGVTKAPDRGKKHVTDTNDKARNPPRAGNKASSSGTQRYVLVVPPPAAAPFAATHIVVPSPTVAIPNVPTTTAAPQPSDNVVPTPTIAIPNVSTSTDVPQPSTATHNDHTSTVAPQPSAATHNDHTTTVVPQPTVATRTVPYSEAEDCTNFQAFTETIPQGYLPRPTIPVLELAAEHDDVQFPSETAAIPVSINNEVPKISEVSLIFSIEYGEDLDDENDDIIVDEEDTSSAACKDANASVPLDVAAVHLTSHVIPSATEPIDTTLMVDPFLSPEKHNNARVQHDIELWNRIKEYDKRAAEEASFIPILTRKQKQNLKKQLTEGQQPCKTTRPRGAESSSQQ